MAAASAVGASDLSGTLSDCAAWTDAMDSAAGATPVALPGADACQPLVLVGGARGVNCRWAFVFRDGAARAQFDAINKAVAACFAHSTAATPEPGVNHPDSYDQIRHRLGASTIAVALKDKGALGQTLVFVTIEGPPAR